MLNLFMTFILQGFQMITLVLIMLILLFISFILLKICASFIRLRIFIILLLNHELFISIHTLNYLLIASCFGYLHGMIILCTRCFILMLSSMLTARPLFLRCCCLFRLF
jgi:hypothetical protein